MIEKASDLINSAPWLMRTLPKLSLKKLKTLANHVRSFHLEPDDSILSVMGFSTPPSQYLISLASAKSGSSLSSFSQLTKAALASLPIVGASIEIHNKNLIEEINEIEISETNPESKDDWATVTKALQHSLAVHTFEESVWRPLVKEQKWPHFSFKDQKAVKEVNTLLHLAVEVKELQGLLDAENAMKSIAESRKLDTVRTRLSDQKRHHSEELADAAVVAELSRSFSPDAQSALIKFAQIAGAAKFSRSAKPSKMSQRQRRRRQEYLTAFDRCCRFIPCWILTTSQISDYLPAECLFDLVVIDESSQSDVTVLPGMMRGKQWLIVGDGKQVSPTEAFVSEENMENLRATLPESPFEDALLPGRSFFDMCAQAFPRGRVVLHEHFRCAPEIIDFSNKLFYDGRLVPLRLPAKRDRFVPSIVDVRLRGGTKVGKVNEQEADKIVEMVREMMHSSESKSRPRSIGIISLIGDEQSRLIRGRLLDSCGPEYLARHDVLIGDPPQFQGAERDVVFLSMVCSKQNCPTQNQQFHFQRANVALSRARDRVVLVRSIDLADIPSLDDVKVPIIEFFVSANEVTKSERAVSQESVASLRASKKNKCFGREILETLLSEKGYQIVDMSKIWKNAFCVEHEVCDARVAILVDCEEPQQSDWLHSYSQQKAIERVGWKCLRVDALSVVVDYNAVVKRVTQFLASHGIEKPDLLQEKTDLESEEQVFSEEASVSSDIAKTKVSEAIEIDDEDEAMNTSNDDEEKVAEKYEVDEIRPDQNQSSADFVGDDTIEAWKFGEVVDLEFLRSRPKYQESDTESIYPVDDDIQGVGQGIFPDRIARRKYNNVKRSPSDLADEEDINVKTTNESDSGKSYDKSRSNRSRSRSRKRRKVSRSSQDGAWNPDDETADDIYDDDDDWMDSGLEMRNTNH